jgi:hypothetical protein
MDKSLKKLYQSFRYIIFKGKYLIPQPPRFPKFNRITLAANPFGMIKKYYPHIINENLIKLNH